ncbi:hypothetical protein [Leptolyngbya sp. NIES-2104]|uniref:hypothetical protein n=1 Tax=Leptolyngbya sp. NIES-2104 TaxID=1552121 RepID=UPI0006EC92BA|nr:hypothetical protein [Leptolyngbya sp. NIES-2104]GAP97188.1 hypothetical protein NIES2104_37350 [Leptolyngbya sp. NIES-2104]
MGKFLTSAIAGLLFIGLIIASKKAIDSMGGLVHFNCRPRSNQVICELTREPLIGALETQQFDKAIFQTTKIQQRGANQTRLAFVTRSGEEIPLTHNWSMSNNQQLFRQREMLDRFLADPSATTIEVRTHRPWQLWAILGGLIGLMILVGAIALQKLPTP